MKTRSLFYIFFFALQALSCQTHKYQIIKAEGYTVPMNGAQKETNDIGFNREVNSYKQQVDSITKQVIGRTEKYMDVKRPQSLLSNFTSDLLKDKVGNLSHTTCDFAVMNMGGLRSNLSKGDISVGNIFSIFPFDNSLSLVKLKGKDVKKLFASIASRKGEGLSREVALTVTPDYKVKSLAIGGIPVDDNRIYTIATIDYLANGNDGMDAFKNATERVDFPIRLRDAVMSYIIEQEALGKALNAVIDHRFIIK